MTPEGHEGRGASGSQEHVALAALFWTFFRVGLLTLGGGLAMAAVVRHELVYNRGWVDDDEFMAEFSTSTLVPGAIAVNVAYLQGRRLRGPAGSAVAVLGTILPSFIIMLVVASVGSRYFSNPWVAAFLRGAAIAVAGQLAFTAYLFARRHLRNWRAAIVCAFSLVMVAVLGLHPVWAVFTAGALGFFLLKSGEEPSEAEAGA